MSKKRIQTAGTNEAPAMSDSAHDQGDDTTISRAIEPTVTELSIIAASLSRGSQDWGALAASALSLWKACKQELKAAGERDQEPLAELRKGLPTPKGNVSFDEFLKLTAPQKRPDDATASYRRFLAGWRNLDMDAVNKILATERREGIREFAFEHLAISFRAWLRVENGWNKSINARSRLVAAEKIDAMRAEIPLRCKEALEKLKDLLDQDYRQKLRRLGPL